MDDVLVDAGHGDTAMDDVLVDAGHGDTAMDDVLVDAGHGDTAMDVLIDAGHGDTAMDVLIDAGHGDTAMDVVHAATAMDASLHVAALMETGNRELTGRVVDGGSALASTMPGPEGTLNLLLQHPTTPKSSSSIAHSSFVPNCKEHSKPAVGMKFDSIDDALRFYKGYAHNAGFSVRIGQHKKENEEIVAKRFYCSREGFRKEKGTKKVPDKPGKKRKAHNEMQTRCGCEAHIYVKLGSDKKYQISSMVEHHNHGLVSPDKQHLLRSYRHVNERAKSTLYNCHKASIGTSQAYRLLHVSEGGFENVGCTLRDLQNYYRDLRSKIKDADAQMFVAQLERKKEVNSAFFYDFEVDGQGRLMRVFWADATSRKNYKHFGDVVSLDSTSQ